MLILNKCTLKVMENLSKYLKSSSIVLIQVSNFQPHSLAKWHIYFHVAEMPENLFHAEYKHKTKLTFATQQTIN
jgi:hypothetical protein